MTEQQNIPTRYLTFKYDKFAGFLAPPYRDVFIEILHSDSEGITFDELRKRVYYKNRLIGPRHLKASLKLLFARDYIITNHQMARLSKSLGIDVNKLRRYEP